MSPKEVYEILHGDYSAIFAAVRNEAVVSRLLKMLQNDKSMEKLAKGIALSDPEEAFRAVHTLKGVALNLHLDVLAARAIDLTEILRPRTLIGYQNAYMALTEEYNRTIQTIAKLN